MSKPTFIRKSIAILLKLVLLFMLTSIGFTLLFRFVPPPFSGVMATQSVSATPSNPKGEIRQQWVSIDRISCHLVRAVVAAEDQKFEHHIGFDISAIQAALRHNLSGGAIRGGSTISQQTAKNLFLWTRRSLLRKGLEAYFTILLETLWSKKRIMEVYLNYIELGDGIYGAESAARTYFKKSAKTLTIAESALLAAMLPSPKTRNPLQPSRRLQRKQTWVMHQMGRMNTSHLCQ